MHTTCKLLTISLDLDLDSAYIVDEGDILFQIGDSVFIFII